MLIVWHFDLIFRERREVADKLKQSIRKSSSPIKTCHESWTFITLNLKSQTSKGRSPLRRKNGNFCWLLEMESEYRGWVLARIRKSHKRSKYVLGKSLLFRNRQCEKIFQWTFHGNSMFSGIVKNMLLIGSLHVHSGQVVVFFKPQN